MRPSEINHGNIPFDTSNCGIRFHYAEQTTVVSLGALRKLRFPIGGKDDPGVNDAARVVLAALGLCAGVLAAEANTSLRSRCHLWPVEEREWELIDTPGQSPRRFRMNGDQAVALLNEAIAAASQSGLHWEEEKIMLRPSPELIQLVQKSQEAAAKEKGRVMPNDYIGHSLPDRLRHGDGSHSGRQAGISATFWLRLHGHGGHLL